MNFAVQSDVLALIRLLGVELNLDNSLVVDKEDFRHWCLSTRFACRCQRNGIMG